MDPAIIDPLIDIYSPRLGPFFTGFVRRVYSKDIQVYAERLTQYGFTGLPTVLDAGCGFGQWSLALASLCGEVHSCDIADVRVDFVRDIASAAAVPNLRVTRQDLTALGFPDAAFDAVFCYGVLFLMPWREALRELMRVTRPGGLLYVNANGIGWYKHLWTTEHNRASDYDPREIAARALWNTLVYERGGVPRPGTDILIPPEELRGALASGGFEDIRQSDEGLLGAVDPEAARARAFFQGHYGGDLGVYEVIARKRPSPVEDEHQDGHGARHR